MSFSSLFTIPTFLLAISINVVMLVIRRVVELIWPSLASHTPATLGENIWERLVLPTLPAILGALFCLLVPPAVAGAFSGFSYPLMVVGTASCILYGVVIGFFAGYLYKVFKFLLKKEWNIDLPSSDDPILVPASASVKPPDELLAAAHEKGQVPPTVSVPVEKKP